MLHSWDLPRHPLSLRRPSGVGGFNFTFALKVTISKYTKSFNALIRMHRLSLILITCRVRAMLGRDTGNRGDGSLSFTALSVCRVSLYPDAFIGIGFGLQANFWRNARPSATAFLTLVGSELGQRTALPGRRTCEAGMIGRSQRGC